MPLANIKLSPPTYNSDADRPPWAEFYDQFMSFILYQDGGPALICLINKALGREEIAFANHTEEFIPEVLRLDEAAIEEYNAILAIADDGAQAEAREIETWHDLEDDEKKLDRDLFSILTQCISGKHRSTITRVQIPSFLQAWCMLCRELGATNIKRKTDLVSKLLRLKYRGDSATFRVEATGLINTIYNSSVTMEDIIMHAIMCAMPRDIAALRLVQQDSLESQEKTFKDVHSFLDTCVNALEITGHDTKSVQAFQALACACARCGRDNHTTEQCYAKAYKWHSFGNTRKRK